MLKPLNDVRSLKDPLKMFMSSWSIGFNPQSRLASLINSNTLELRCQTFGMPTLTGDQTTVEWSGFKRVYAGKQTRQGSWSVQFTEVWDSSIIEVLKQWVNMYHNYKNGTVSLLNEYAATINVTLLDPDIYDTNSEGSNASRYDIRLYDAFPTSVKLPSTINASSSDPINIDCEFNYNYFLMGNEID